MKSLCLLGLFLYACVKSDQHSCLLTNGRLQTITRNLEDFDRILINGRYKIKVVSDTLNYIEITAGENILPFIKTTVHQNQLMLDATQKCSFVKGYRHIPVLNLHVKKVNEIKHFGSETLEIEYQKPTDTLRCYTEGSGDILFSGNLYQLYVSAHGFLRIDLKGVCKRLNAWISGSAYLYADSMQVKDFVFLESVSIADAYVNGRDLNFFSCTLNETGNIYLMGNPNTVLNYSSSQNKGQLIWKP